MSTEKECIQKTYKTTRSYEYSKQFYEYTIKHIKQVKQPKEAKSNDGIMKK
ncbi:MAG: hypothetical protein V1870_03855 [Candidatus Aenigmatarchaeota archaeon]